MQDEPDTAEPPKQPPVSDNSSFYLKAGMGLGAYAATTTVLLGVACPVCVIAAPALIATGLYQKSKKKKTTPASSHKEQKEGREEDQETQKKL